MLNPDRVPQTIVPPNMNFVLSKVRHEASVGGCCDTRNWRLDVESSHLGVGDS